jgi:hypothetical protein
MGMNGLTITDVLAAYGAALASIGFGWNLYRDLHDRAHLKVKADIRRIVQIPGGKWYAVAPDLGVAGASAQLFVVVNVTNDGRRPVQWMGWGGKYRKPVNGKGSFTVIPGALPMMLNEGDTHSEHTDHLDPAGENVKRVFIWDASGKNWYLPRRKLRKLREEARKFQGMP